MGVCDLKLTVMDLWWAARERVLVREVFDDLVAPRDIAYRTVKSTMESSSKRQIATRAGC